MKITHIITFLLLAVIVSTAAIIVRTKTSACSIIVADAWTSATISSTIGKRRTQQSSPLSSPLMLIRPSSSLKSLPSSSSPSSSSAKKVETTKINSIVGNRTTIKTNDPISTESLNLNLENSNLNDGYNDFYFIRSALIVDMDRASKILADGFYKSKTNFFTYQYEKFKTFLSLEANFPTTPQARSKYEIYVACCVMTGEVWGMIEIDARSRGERSSVFQQSGGSPYMCNLAIDERHQRKGIATSLVYECERQVQEWHNKYTNNNNDDDDDDDDNSYETIIINNSNNTEGIKMNYCKNNYKISNSVCLKVRESNKAAVQMYLKLGYLTVWQEKEVNNSAENILVMRKQLSSSSADTRNTVKVTRG